MKPTAPIETEAPAEDDLATEMDRVMNSAGEWIPARRTVFRSAGGREVAAASIASASQRINEWLLFALLTAAVLCRFFTETWPVLPRFFNFFDPPFLMLFLFWTAMLISRRRRTFRTFGLGPYIFGFFLVWLASNLLNLPDIGLLSSLGFLYLWLCPVAFFLLVSNWDIPRRSLQRYVLFLMVLGGLQLAVSFLYQLPVYLQTGDPDLVGGTFGENNSQYCFFLIFVIFLCLSFYLQRVQRKWTAAFVVLAVVAFYVAGWRAMWFGFPLLLVVLLGVTVRTSFFRKGTAILLTLGVGILSILLIGGELERLSSLVDWRGVAESGKVRAFLDLPQLYSEAIHYPLVGVGPGTYSSQAFLFFRRPPANPWASRWDPKMRFDAASGRVWADTGSGYIRGEPIPSLSRRYVMPLYWKKVFLFGSSNTDSPFLSYISALAEVGILGFLLLVGIYAKLGFALLRLYRNTRDIQTKALAFACLGLLGMLMGAGFLENWFEVPRVTLLLWVSAALCVAAGSPNEIRNSKTARDYRRDYPFWIGRSVGRIAKKVASRPLD